MELHVLMPVYNDWPSAERLLRELNDAAASHGLSLSATLVDDGSTEAATWPADFRAVLPHVRDIEILPLRGNRGQPLAVTVGLAHLLRRGQRQPVLLMDADGQDRVADVPRLAAAFREDPSRMLLAARRSRTEGLFFRAGYQSFQLLFRLLSGQSFRIGTFGIYPMAQIEALLRVPSLQNSIAGTVMASGLAERFVETDRGQRTYGRSRFGLSGHLRHAASILAANRARICARLARASGIASMAAVAATALYVAFGETLAMDGWTVLGVAVALLCGTLGLVLTLSRSAKPPKTVPTPQALCTEHIAEASAGNA